MFNLLENAKNCYECNEATIKFLKKQLDGAPEGSLRVLQRGQGIYYYHRFQENRTTKDIYISAANIGLAKKLAEKGYYSKLLQVISDEQASLKGFIDTYRPELKYEIANDLLPQKRALVSPLLSPEEEALERWKNEPRELSDFLPSRLIYETMRGEMVRSKSEVIIANYLNSCNRSLDYQYEAKLWLPSSQKHIYPDFKIFVYKTGRIFYLEHVGMLDDPDYASSFIHKNNEYISNGLWPGRDVIYTYESSACPLNVSSLKELLYAALKI